MLIIDPKKRISLREIITHRWMTLDGADPEFESLIEESLHVLEGDVDGVSEQVLQTIAGASSQIDVEQMKQVGYSPPHNKPKILMGWHIL